MEPSLSSDVVGAWWYPQDMSIDAQRMFRVLEQACSKAGVEILEGCVLQWIGNAVVGGWLYR